MNTTYTDLGTGEVLDSSDPRTMGTREERIAAAAAEQAAFEAGDQEPTRCPFCHQPESAPDCARREHWGVN